MSYKYNWSLLRAEFITGSWLTVSDFFRDKGISSNSRTRTNAKGWNGARVDYLKKVISQTQQKAIESETDIRIRQQQEAKLLQRKGLEKLDELEIRTVEEARRLITSGLQEERLALGLDQKTATQVQSYSTSQVIKRYSP
ncbi:MAG: hypothetical protein ACOZBZ_02760 [Patescibacteria group bacterium]